MKRRTLFASLCTIFLWPFRRKFRSLVYTTQVTTLCVGNLVRQRWGIEPVTTRETFAVIQDNKGKILFNGPLSKIASINDALTQVVFVDGTVVFV